MKTKTAVLNGKPDAGNPHVRFDEGDAGSSGPRPLLYDTGRKVRCCLLAAAVAAAVGLAASSVKAEEYAWAGGGENGKWTDPQNWGVASGYPASSSDTAKFTAAAAVQIDLATDSFAGGGVKVSLGEGASVTIGSSAQERPTFACAPTVPANATLTFDHVQLSGNATSSAETSVYRFVNDAKYAPGQVHTFAKGGLWFFEDSTLGGHNELLLGYQSSEKCNLVLVNSSADRTGGRIFDSNTRGGGWIHATNSTLLCGNASQNQSINLENGAFGVVISGDESRFDLAGTFKMNSGSTLEFDYGRADRAAIVMASGDFKPSAGARLVVGAPSTVVASTEVMLLSTPGSLDVPAAWTEMQAESVVAHEYVKRIYVSNEGGLNCLMATIAPPSLDPDPIASLQIPADLDGREARSVLVNVSDRGHNATKSSVSVRLYADAEHTQLIATCAPVTDSAADQYSARASFGALVFGTTYFVVATVTNDAGGSIELEDSFAFAFPKHTGNTFVWSGLGTDCRWDNPENWGCSDACPTSAVQVMVFPSDCEVTVDLAGGSYETGSISLNAGSSVTFRNGTMKAPVVYVEGDGTVLTFDAVNCRLDTQGHYYYCKDADGTAHTGNRINVLNGSFFRPTSNAFLPGMVFDMSVVDSELRCDGGLEQGQSLGGSGVWAFVNAKLTVPSNYAYFRSGVRLALTNLTCEVANSFFQLDGGLPDLVGGTKITAGASVKLTGAISVLRMHTTEAGYPQISSTGDVALSGVQNLDLSLKGWQTCAPKGTSGDWVLAESIDGTLTFPPMWTNVAEGASYPLETAVNSGRVTIDFAEFHPKKVSLLSDGRRLILRTPLRRGLMIFLR